MYLNEEDFFVKRIMTTIICTSLFLTACSNEKEITKTNTTPKTQTTTIQTTPQKENLYASYMNKATLIGQNFDEAAYAIDGERQDSFAPMLKAFDTSYKQWDALLNEIL